MLGVDPDTLRRWADNGKVDVFTTPGGHRRFLRSAIDALLPRQRAVKRPSLTAMGETPDKVAAEFRKRVRTDVTDQDWHTRFDEGSLRWFRERGVRMSDLLLGHLDTARRAGQDQYAAQAESLHASRAAGRRGKQHKDSVSRATTGQPLEKWRPVFPRGPTGPRDHTRTRAP